MTGFSERGGQLNSGDHSRLDKSLFPISDYDRASLIGFANRLSSNLSGLSQPMANAIRGALTELCSAERGRQLLPSEVTLFHNAVLLLARGIHPECDRSTAQVQIFTAILQGFVSALELCCLQSDRLPQLIVGEPQSDGGISPNALDFAIQYGGVYSARELQNIFSDPARLSNIDSETLDDQTLILAFLRGRSGTVTF